MFLQLPLAILQCVSVRCRNHLTAKKRCSKRQRMVWQEYVGGFVRKVDVTMDGIQMFPPGGPLAELLSLSATLAEISKAAWELSAIDASSSARHVESLLVPRMLQHQIMRFPDAEQVRYSIESHASGPR